MAPSGLLVPEEDVATYFSFGRILLISNRIVISEAGEKRAKSLYSVLVSIFTAKRT